MKACVLRVSVVRVLKDYVFWGREQEGTGLGGFFS